MKFTKFFSHIQETPWYRTFLNPVLEEISIGDSLLDIGTGSGKLIQLVAEQKDIKCIGVDTNEDMLIEAQKKVRNTTAQLLLIKPNDPLPLKDESFDYVTICSVLFHLKKDSIDSILNDALRTLKNDGKIIVLTPTGNGNFLTLSKQFFSFKNYSIFIWFYATRNRAGPWTKNKYLKQYAIKNELKYKREVVMNGFAQLEIITK